MILFPAAAVDIVVVLVFFSKLSFSPFFEKLKIVFFAIEM